MQFVDEITITVASGKGGPGAVSFRREAMVPRGGPDGGDGGRGGDVIFRPNPQLGTLLDLRFKKIYKGGDGEKGGGQHASGLAGEDCIIQVPLGTVIKTPDGEVLADLSSPVDFTLITGGRGGKGNAFFKTSVNQAPEHAQPGEPSQRRDVRVVLKLIADIGIIGLPNAGKSTLISRISAARPKIADYPFTTLVPNLGVVKVAEGKSLTVADIPGLIEGVHQGTGLGIRFLKHIERTKGFVHLIDVSPMAMQDPVKAYEVVNKELKKYDETNEDDLGGLPLSKRKQIVVINKIDTIDDNQVEEILAKFKKKKIKAFPMSSVSGKNVKELIFQIGEMAFGKEKDLE